MILQRIFCVFIFLISAHGITLLQTKPLISNITLNDNQITIKPHQNFKKKYLSDDFFVRYEKKDVDVKDLNASTVIMPFLMNVIPLIWLSGEVWDIEEIDQSLFQSLTLLKTIFAHFYPKASWNGTLRVKRLVSNTIASPKTNTFAMPFSGGLDSIHTSLSYPEEHQILITVREHVGYVNDIQWSKAIKNVVAFAQIFGHDNVFVESNYQRFIKADALFCNTPGMASGTSHGLGWVGIAAPVLIAKRCNLFRIASSLSWNFPYQKPLCPMIDDNIAFANITVRHDGFNFRRVDKTEAALPFFKNTQRNCILYVCQKNNDGKNCCSCEKCKRTLGALIALGETSFAPYGFDITLQDAQALIRKSTDFWAQRKPWRLGDLQSKIHEKDIADTSLFLKWLVSVTIDPKTPEFDFHQFEKVVSRLKEKSRINFTLAI